MDAGADTWEAGIGYGREAELGGGAAELLEVRGKKRLPGCGGGGWRVRGRHGVVEEVGEARCGGTGCQSGQLEFGGMRALLFYLSCSTLGW
jgi:hypothetical protein